MIISFTIPGTLPGLNDYVKANRSNLYKGNQMSRDAHYLCKLGMIKLAGKRLEHGFIDFRWYEKNKRRDKDNISAAKKFILDAMQEMGIFENDGWKQIDGFSDRFFVDKDNPRIEVDIRTDIEAEQTTWISTKERLPELVEEDELGNKYSDIVITFNGQHIQTGFYQESGPRKFFCPTSCMGWDIQATHWQYAPKPPEEE